MDSSARQYLQPADWSGARNAWQVRPGLWRMGRFEWVDSFGWDQMLDDGVKTVVDVRTLPEVKRREQDPQAFIPDEIQRVHLPVEDVNHAAFGSVTPLIRVILIRITIRWIRSGIVWHVQSRWYWVLGRPVVLCCIAQPVGIGPVWCSDYFYSCLISPEALRTGTSRKTYMPLAPTVSMSIIGLVRSHPYESYLQPEAFERELSDRLASFRQFLRQWPGERVQELLARQFVQ